MNGWGVRVRSTSAVFILGGVDCLSGLLGGLPSRVRFASWEQGPMVGGHPRHPHISPPCSPASRPHSCVLGLPQAPGLCELPIWPWAPLRELVGGDPQLLAVGGVPWGFAPLCCGSQRAPGSPAPHPSPQPPLQPVSCSVPLPFSCLSVYSVLHEIAALTHELLRAWQENRSLVGQGSPGC